MKEDLLRRETSVEKTAVLSVAGHQPVILIQDVGGSERIGFLTHVLRVGAHPTGSLKFEGDLVKLPAENHVSVEADQIGIGNQILPEFLVELAVFIKDRDSFDLGAEGSGDRHGGILLLGRPPGPGWRRSGHGRPIKRIERRVTRVR